MSVYLTLVGTGEIIAEHIPADGGVVTVCVLTGTPAEIDRRQPPSSMPSPQARKLIRDVGEFPCLRGEHPSRPHGQRRSHGQLDPAAALSLNG
jgi:hypothetical protein